MFRMVLEILVSIYIYNSDNQTHHKESEQFKIQYLLLSFFKKLIFCQELQQYIAITDSIFF